MKRLFTLCMLLAAALVSRQSQAQPAVGTLAPDWTYKDIYNVSHHLYNYLDSGYMVAIDVSAAWCSPCWGFHNTHVADALTTHYGPNGTIQPKKIKFIFVEGDRFTGTADLYGNTSISQGNWVAGANYPIIDTSGLNIPYKVTGYPTFIAICPNKRVVFANAGNAGVAMESFWVNLMNTCPAPSASKDVALLSTEDTVNLCGNTVLIQNMWNQPLTSATVQVYKGAALLASQAWTGNLKPFGVTSISFPAGTPANGQGNLKYKLVVSGDTNAQNDTLSSGYDMAQLSGNKIRIELKTDRLSYEDSWTLKDGNTVIASKEYGLYDTMKVFTYNYTVNSGACLRFALHDLYGNGIGGGSTFTTLDDGYIKIYDGNNNNLLASATGWGFGRHFVRHYRAAGAPASVREEAQEASLDIVPNPASGMVTLNYSGMRAEEMTLTIADMTGRKVYSRVPEKTTGTGNTLQFSVEDWPAGLYLLNLQSGSSRITRKLQVLH